MIVVVRHVDDILTGGTREKVDETKAHVGRRFKLKDLDPANVFIGLQITRDREKRTITLDQAHYARDILDLYGFDSSNSISIPMQPTLQLTKAGLNEGLPEKERKLYQTMVSSLGYLMNCNNQLFYRF